MPLAAGFVPPRQRAVFVDTLPARRAPPAAIRGAGTVWATVSTSCASFTPATLATPATRALDDSDRAAVAAVVGGVECFDQTVFALAAWLVFPAVFFPYWGDLLGPLYGAALFALAFAARPLGRWGVTVLRGRLGGSRLLLVCGALLAACTAAVGTLPGFAAAGGLAVLLLVACRAAQGLAWGASAALHPPLGGGSAVLGALVGVAAAAALMAVIASQMVHADFIAWGWRYPFCAALATHVVVLFARVRVGSSAR